MPNYASQDDIYVRIARTEETVNGLHKDIDSISKNVDRLAMCVEELTKTQIRIESVIITNKEFYEELTKYIQENHKTNERVSQLESLCQKTDDYLSTLEELNERTILKMSEMENEIGNIKTLNRVVWAGVGVLIAGVAVVIEYFK